MPRKSSPADAALNPADALCDQCEKLIAENEMLADALQAAQQALQRRTNIETAIARTREQASAAKRRVSEIDGAMPELDAQLALAGGDAAIDSALEDEVARLQARVDDASRERTDKQTEFERSERTVTVLEKELMSVDADITAAQTAVALARAAVREELMPHIDQAIADACAELAKVKAVMLALERAGVPLENDAAALRVVAPGSAIVETTPYEVIAHGDDLLAQADPTGVRAPDGLADIVRRLRVHRPYSSAQEGVFERALKAPYTTRSASADRIADIERREGERLTQTRSRPATIPATWTAGVPR